MTRPLARLGLLFGMLTSLVGCGAGGGDYDPTDYSQRAFTVTLDWDSPGDLDLHVFTPNGQEIYWGNFQGSDGYLNEDNHSYGPENYFCERPTSGRYRVFVRHYQGPSATATVTLRIHRGDLAGREYRYGPVELGPTDGSYYRAAKGATRQYYSDWAAVDVLVGNSYQVRPESPYNDGYYYEGGPYYDDGSYDDEGYYYDDSLKDDPNIIRQQTEPTPES